MVNTILSDHFVPHNHPHALAVEQFLSAHDKLVHVRKMLSMTTFALTCEPEHYGCIDAESLYNYFWILDDQAEGANAASGMGRLQKFVIHSDCDCQPAQPPT